MRPGLNVKKTVEYWSTGPASVLVLGPLADECPTLPEVGDRLKIVGIVEPLFYMVEDICHTWKVFPDGIDVEQVILVTVSRRSGPGGVA